MNYVKQQIVDELRKIADSIECDGEADGAGFAVFVYDEFDEKDIKRCELFDVLDKAVQFHVAASENGESSHLRFHIDDMRINILNSESKVNG